MRSSALHALSRVDSNSCQNALASIHNIPTIIAVKIKLLTTNPEAALTWYKVTIKSDSISAQLCPNYDIKIFLRGKMKRGHPPKWKEVERNSRPFILPC